MTDWMRRIESAFGIPQDTLNAPPEKVTATEVQIGRPKGVLFHCPRECIGLPGIVPAGHFDTDGEKEPPYA